MIMKTKSSKSFTVNPDKPGVPPVKGIVGEKSKPAKKVSKKKK